MHIKDEAPICIGVHAVFANDAFNVLKEAGTDKIVTCNTIVHSSNDIDLSEVYVSTIKEFVTIKK